MLTRLQYTFWGKKTSITGNLQAPAYFLSCLDGFLSLSAVELEQARPLVVGLQKPEIIGSADSALKLALHKSLPSPPK